MDADVQAFLDKWEEKKAAKAEALKAAGEARLAEYEGRDSDAARHWAIVESRGIKGDEGRLQAEAFAMAEAYVDSHPQMFVSFESMVNPDDHSALVTLCGVMGKMGRKEDEAKLMMFEMTRFERQHIGQRFQVAVKFRG